MGSCPGPSTSFLCDSEQGSAPTASYLTMEGVTLCFLLQDVNKWLNAGQVGGLIRGSQFNLLCSPDQCFFIFLRPYVPVRI